MALFFFLTNVSLGFVVVFIFSELVTDFIAVVKWHDRG